MEFFDIIKYTSEWMKPTLKSTEGLRKNSSSFCFEFLIDARSEDLAEHLWHHQTVQINNNVHHVSSVKSNIICSSVVKFKWLKNNGHYLPEMSLYIVNTSVFIPGRPFLERPGFLDFFIPEFPGMKTARFPGKSGNSEQPSLLHHCALQRLHARRIWLLLQQQRASGPRRRRGA